MRMITSNRTMSALLAVALTLPVAAWAANPPTTANGDTSAAPAANSRQAKVEERISDMHATLHITKAEEPQWDAFAQVMMDNAQTMDNLLSTNASKAESQNAQQMMQSYAAIAEQHAQDMQKLSAAFDKVYASLSPEQQKAADEMFHSNMQKHEEKQGG